MAVLEGEQARAFNARFGGVRLGIRTTDDPTLRLHYAKLDRLQEVLLVPAFARGEIGPLFEFVAKEDRYMASIPGRTAEPRNTPLGHGYVIVDESSKIIFSCNRRFPLAAVPDHRVTMSEISDADFDALLAMIVGAVEEKHFERVFPGLPFTPITSWPQLKKEWTHRGLDAPRTRFVLRLPGWSVCEFPPSQDGLLEMKKVAAEMAPINDDEEETWRKWHKYAGMGMDTYDG
ncbi:hypothetical protein O9X98_14705 [Agrobacterium salinitolerans]|nr:hypothetical protein [Agrobacterium salinitolerans]